MCYVFNVRYVSYCYIVNISDPEKRIYQPFSMNRSVQECFKLSVSLTITLEKKMKLKILRPIFKKKILIFKDFFS